MHPLNDLVDSLGVIVFRPATRGISQKLCGQRAVKLIAMPGGDNVFQLGDVLEALAGYQTAGCVYGLAPFLIAPDTQSVEVLERQTERIHPRVTGKAQRRGSMGFQRFLQGWLVVLKVLLRRFQQGDIWRRWRRGTTQNIVENKQAALHRRSSVRV